MRQNEPPGMPRGTKTLAWFMDRTGIFEKQQQQQQMMQVRRNSSSDDSKSTTPSAQQQFQQHQQIQQHQQQQKKQKRYRKTLSQQGTTRKEAFGGSQAMSESSEEGTAIISTALTSSGASSCATPGISAPTANSNNEEYWFYDVATDGYYYEQNGAKGWRRRQPNQAVHKSAGKDSEVAHMNVNGPSKYNQLLAAQAAAAQAAFLQQAFQLQAQQASQAPQGGAQAPPQQQQPTMRYYDANSDGFFYEMASVDGWKRRQPNKPVSASVPAGITRPYSQRPAAQQIPQEVAPHHPSTTAAPTSGGSSYGAALARGQFPRNTVKHDEKCAQNAQQPRGDSTSSSQCGDTFAELFSSSDPVYIPRPSALNLEQKAVSPSENSTAALFDAVLADFGGFKATSANLNPLLPGISSQSPMKGESWNSFRSCSLFSPIKPSKRAPLSSNGQTQASAGMEDFDDDSTMKMLIQDLDKLWANSPVSGLNQA